MKSTVCQYFPDDYHFKINIFPGSTSPSEATIGPVLPATSGDCSIGPQLNLHASDSEFDEEDESVSIGPVMPPSSSSIRNRGDQRRKDSESEDDDDSYGPQMPPSVLKSSSSSRDDEGDSYGPRLPAGVAGYGPKLPSSFADRDDDDDDSYGPKLPQSLSSAKSDNDTFGPRLPGASSTSKQQDSSDDDCYGPTLPPPPSSSRPSSSSVPVKGPSLPPSGQSSYPVVEDEEEDDVIGPMPSRSGDFGGKSAAEEFEARALAMKNKLTGKVLKKDEE